MNLADRSKLDADVARINRLVEQSSRVLVVGPTGAGRGQLFAALRARSDVVAVEAPPLTDADAAVHPVLAAAGKLGREVVRCVEQHSAPAERAGALAHQLVAAEKILVLRLPSAWRAALARSGGDPEPWLLAERAWTSLRTWNPVKDLRLVVIGDSSLRRSDVFERFVVHELTPMRLDLQHAAAQQDWGSYAIHAQSLAEAAEAAGAQMTPVQFRIAVGLIALGTAARHIVGRIVSAGTVASSLQVLENWLVDVLFHQGQIAASVSRLALARFPLPRQEALTLSRMPASHEPLITECLAYGDESLRMHDRVREAVLHVAGRLGADEREAVHYELARDHARGDGARAIHDAPDAHRWLERAFHLAHSGERGAAEWAQLALPARELYWERGRALSRSRRYGEAAAVYRDCTHRFPDDDYAWHYFAYNVDRAGELGDEAERAYREAVQRAPSNAWWNARLVTHLIDRARFLAAREEWTKSIERIERESEGSLWLALHFHRWVVLAWLDQGQVQLAREAFDLIAREAIEQDSRLAMLGQRLCDAEEAERLGDSVYPASVPMQDRWQAPRLVPAESSIGSMRVGWGPARVVEADGKRVLLVIGQPARQAGEAPRLLLKEMTRDAWRAAARSSETPSGFWELGSYADGEVQALRDPAAPVVPDRFEDRDPLRFMTAFGAERPA